MVSVLDFKSVIAEVCTLRLLLVEECVALYLTVTRTCHLFCCQYNSIS